MERAIPILPTDDFADAKAFYVDRLEFRITFQPPKTVILGYSAFSGGTIEMTRDSPMSEHR